MMLKQANLASGNSIFDVKPQAKDVKDMMIRDEQLEVPSSTNALGKNASSPCTSMRKKL